MRILLKKRVQACPRVRLYYYTTPNAHFFLLFMFSPKIVGMGGHFIL